MTTTFLASLLVAAQTLDGLVAPQENTKLPPAQMAAIQAMMAD
ncbi:MAG: hypothetical protein AAF390_11315 [Pseudomonadota bacterium]